ncbi:hypothetical protein [Microbacterium sp. NPDC087665]|uniref:hypothetical protein n=1 Tax=Microbacterium sp. NPDC087665 TaxID=3364194 RepID=UPI0038041E7C
MLQSLFNRWRRSRAPFVLPGSSAAEPARIRSHEAAWGNVTIYFVHTLTTKKPIVLGRAVHKLLKSELARTAAWPSEDVVRLSPELAKVDRGAAKLRRLNAWSDARSWSSLGRLFIRHPLKVVQLLGAAIYGLFASRSGDDDNLPDLADSIREVERMLVRQQQILVMERQVDRELFAQEITIDEPFVRMQMRGSYHTIVVDGKEAHVVLEPRLLLHRDGAIQITVGVALPAGLDTTHLIEGIAPEADIIAKSEIPEPYAGKNARWHGGEWAEELDAGTRMRVIHHEERLALFDWIEIAEQRILALIGAKKDGTGLVYPVTIAEAGACCDSWEAQHAEDVAQVVSMTVTPADERSNYVPGPSMAATSGTLVHADLGSALIVELRSGEPGADDLEYSLLFERTVLLFMRLRALEKKLIAVSAKPKEVRRTYRAALELERETRGGHILHGGARDIADHVLGTFGVPRMLEVIARALTIMGERGATRASEKAARTANRFAAVSLFVAFVAAVPAVPSILNFVAAQRQADPNATGWAIAQDLLNSPLQLSVLLAAVVGGVVLMNVVVVVVKVVRLALSWRKRGWASLVRGWRIVSGPDPEQDAGIV